MLEVQWEYPKKDYLKDDPVAILKKADTNQIILYVYQGYDRYKCICSSEFNFLKGISNVRYSQEHNLKKACSIIEKDMYKQIERIIELIS